MAPDTYGRTWPRGIGVCPTCGQPDDCGDCDHVKLAPAEVAELGGVEGTRAIKLTWSTVDHHTESRAFSTLVGARRYAHRKVGAHPEIGSTYAVDAWGTSKIVIRAGATLAEIFPDPPEPREMVDDGSYDRGPYSRWE